MPKEPKDRLKEARKARFPSAADAARAMQIPYSTYAAHENGQNDLSVESADFYGRTFKVSAGWILTGEPTIGRDSVPVRGYVGAGFVIMPLGQDDAELERVKPPPGVRGKLEAVRVRGNSMEPAFYDGDLIFYDANGDTRPAGELLGRECVVATSDGNMYIKRLRKGSRAGLFVLLSYNTDPILDVRLDWACPVKYIQRA